MNGYKASDHTAKAGVLVLAAGKGTRMYSSLPKVLHPLLDKPMIWYLLNTLNSIFAARTMVIGGHGFDQLKTALHEWNSLLIHQEQQLGTGHALQVAWPAVQEMDIDWLVVINGDTPLITDLHIQMLMEQVQKKDADIGFISLTLPEPGSYGRVLRGTDGEPEAVVEAKDFIASGRDVAEINEVNSGLYVFKTASVEKILFQLDADNQQKEYYITQLIALGLKKGLKVVAFNAGNCPELLGINTSGELLRQEEWVRARIVDRFIEQGVIIRARDSVRIGAEVEISPGAEITGPAEILGKSTIASECKIKSHCFIEDSFIDKAQVFSFSHVVKSVIGKNVKIGPYARLRPGTTLHEGASAGNFVEIKNSTVGSGSKINHLSYIGDTQMGCSVNIGAGTITCNYDGRCKHKTIIEDRVFIGSNTALVAPVRVQRESMIGAGSTITRDVSPGSLSIARSRQKDMEGKNPLKTNKKE